MNSPFIEALRDRGASLPANLISGTSLNLRVGLLPSGRFVTLMPYSVLRFGPCASSSRNFLSSFRPGDCP